MNEVVLFETRKKAVIEAFEEALVHSKLSYSLDALKRYGFTRNEEISMALKRAFAICRSLGLNSRGHFGYIFNVDMVNHEVSREWRASKLGFYLVLCNGPANNPFVGALQMEFLKEILSKLE